MARVPYILDGRMFAKKIKHSAQLLNWRSDVSICCPNCSCKIDNSYMQQDWPGLPLGVKFDPTDQELLKHLQAKSGCGNERLHPFIDDFISTLDGNSGICYTHPEKLPGVGKDGSCIHFFHKTVKAYATGTRKRRKIQNEDDPAAEDLRWHKTGKTRAVLDNGKQLGCKKIMVLYVTPAKGVKAEKTNWVMHQYHLGTEEDEKANEYVISKVFFQHQAKQEEAGSSKTGPLTPSSAATPPRPLKQNACTADEREHDWLLPNMLCDEHLSPDTSNYSSPLGAGDHITESSKEREMFNTSVKLNAPANENKEERHLHPPNSEVAEPASEKKLLEPNEEGDCFSESFLPDVSLDSQLFGESQFFVDSQEMLQNVLFCAETLNGTPNQETKEEEQGVAPWPEGGRIIADEDDDADEGRIPASPKQNVTTFPEEGHVIGDGDNIQDVPRPVSPSLSNIYVDSLPEIQFNESQFSSQESLSGWIKKTFNFSENDSQGMMDDNIMQDSQFI